MDYVIQYLGIKEINQDPCSFIPSFSYTPTRTRDQELQRVNFQPNTSRPFYQDKY